jgi:hypothetical protein
MPLKSAALTIFFLLDIMKDRTSTRPVATSYDGNWEEESSREDKDNEQAIDDALPEQIVLLDDDFGAATSHQHMSAVDKSLVDAQSKTTPSKKPKRKTTSSASMSDASLLYGGDSAVASVMAQSAVDRTKQKQAAFAEHLRHNKQMETIWKQELMLNTRCLEMEQKSVELDHKRLEIGNDSDRIALKDKLVDRYEKYKAKK